MPEDRSVDHYETLQISPNADPDTVHRVYRLLAQRFHPDNRETGDAARFRALHEAYTVLSDPESRAKYDVVHQQHRQDRWRLVSSGQSDDEFEIEKVIRLTVLEVLLTKRRVTPQDPGLYDIEFEQMIGRPREHLEFTFWYLSQKGLIKRADSSRLVITAEGVDYLEQRHQEGLQRRRLREANKPSEAA
jgi:curved DNA-binding protein CbpA